MELEKITREAAVINLLDAFLGDAWNDRVKTELWCIREGINTEKHPEIWDVTLGSWPTSTIVNYVLDSDTRSRHDNAAFLLCTMHELS
jgi:hypothetical protein